MSEYTKGEWKPIDCKTQSKAWKVKSGEVWICTVWGDDRVNAEANAHLIAVAPIQNQLLTDVYADAELLPDGRYAITEKRLQDIKDAIDKAQSKTSVLPAK